MIASLPMYDSASTRAANDRFWQAIKRYIGYGPEDLDRHSDPHDVWVDKDLLLSQTCGLPFRTELVDRVALVGTPDYGIQGCPPGYYNSVIVVRADETRTALSEFQNATLARNDQRSQSGWAALVAQFLSANLQVPSKIVESKAHRTSAQMVAQGTADIAALDAVSWTIIQRETDLGKRLRVIQITRPTPGLPYITARNRNPNDLFDAVAAGISALSPQDQNALLLKGIVYIPASDYLAVGTNPKAK